MIYLFIHQNFPAQYQHLVRHLVEQPGNVVYFITQPNNNEMRGVRKITYTEDRPPVNCHPLTVEFDRAVRAGSAVAKICGDLKDAGVRPDIVIGHNGWGETMFVKDVFPEVPLLSYFEFYYHLHGVDVDFDPEFVSIFSDPARLRIKNAVNLIGLDSADWGHTATRWQKSLYPPELRRRITVIHEGVDTDTVRPEPSAFVSLARQGMRLTCDDEVITYVARNLEPYRGFHIFMRAAPEILRRRPKAHIVIVGGNSVSYGAPPPPRKTWREVMTEEVGSGLDFERIHFLGQIEYAAYLNLLRISSAHIYLTYPFVLSWSFIEALATGCLVIGSATPPVTEVLQDRVNGLLVDFFSPRALVALVDEALSNQAAMQPLRDAARQTAVARFDLKRRQLPLWMALIDDLVNGRRPAADAI